MSKSQKLRSLVKQRLTAAAEEIFGLFETTIAEYEEELCRSKEENERKQKLLDAVFSSNTPLQRADVQQVLVIKEEVPPEEREWSSSLEQEDHEGQEEPDHPNIKEEEEDLWTGQEGERLRGLEEADVIKFPFSPVSVKSEDDEEKPQPSQLYQRQTEQMENEDHGEDWGGPEPEPASCSDPERHQELITVDMTGDASELETEDSGDWKEAREHQSGFSSWTIENNVSVSGFRFSTVEKQFSCSDWGEGFGTGENQRGPMSSFEGEKPFSCSVCQKTFTQKGYLQGHMKIHSGEKPFSCLICGKRFIRKVQLTQHMTNHTGEKTISCSVCQKTFTQSGCLQRHMRLHTGEKPFSCLICDKRYFRMEHLKSHMRTHTGEKPFSCSICNKSFAHNGNLQTHLKTHTGEKPFSCSLCDRAFTQKSSLQLHMTTHTGERPFGCSFCGKAFSQKSRLQMHIKSHTGEMPLMPGLDGCKDTLVHYLSAHTEEKNIQLQLMERTAEDQNQTRTLQPDIVEKTGIFPGIPKV
ncbi:gastrula zinc finger protein XlCGF57.1-like [Centropristis striata]|uniref:gastrula zinc finger protein XlCGF57.1-like n=1 Tax=Centropristis striata TaxID=184440 RepID=UPI0027E19859|nr:gastrula zinc finger protein XlCGF57.1-like [Centropristis striata]